MKTEKSKQIQQKEHYLDLKSHDRLRLFKGNNLEMIIDVDSVQEENMVVYVKNNQETRRHFIKSHCEKYLCSDVTIQNQGSRGYGERFHVKIKMPFLWEYQRQ